MKEISHKIVDSTILGLGLLESAYEKCLCHELGLRKIQYENQKELPVEYKGVKLDCGYRLDILVANRVIVELKPCNQYTKRNS